MRPIQTKIIDKTLTEAKIRHNPPKSISKHIAIIIQQIPKTNPKKQETSIKYIKVLKISKLSTDDHV